jgi:hypothetical protein
VAQANESLTIDIDIRDKLSPEVAKLTAEVKAFGETAKKQFDATNKVLDKLPESVKKTGTEAKEAERKVNAFADSATRKFQALGKAAVGIFTADLIARAFGFSGALDVINKASQAFADTIRGAINPGLREMENAAERARAVIEALRQEQEQLQALARKDVRTIPGFVNSSDKYTLFGRNDFEIPGRDVDVGRFKAGDPYRGQAIALIASAEARINAAIAELRSRGATGASSEAREAERARYQKAVEQIQTDIVREIDALARKRDAWERATEATTAHAMALAEANKIGREAVDGGFAEKRNEALKREAEFALKAAGAQAILADRRSRAMLGRGGAGLAAMGASAAMFASRFQVGDVGSLLSFDPTARPNLGGGALGFTPSGQPWRPSGTQGLGGFLNARLQQGVPLDDVAPEQQFKNFGEAVRDEISLLGRSLEENLGSQAVQGVFLSFTNFFMDLFTNARNADEAIKNLGRSLLSVLASQAAQRLATGATNFLFGSIGLTSQANGGVWRGGINSFAQGGVAYGPQLAMIGDNKSRTEAIVPMPDGRSIPVEMRGSGGGTVNLTLNVASLDPRSAADVVLAQSRKIQDMIAAALSENMGLRRAVRGAVA